MSKAAEAEVIEHEPTREVAPLQPSGVLTPMDLINQALARGTGMDVIEKMMVLQERYEAMQERREINQARKEFDEAIAAAKAEIQPIVRNATGHNSKKYADFAAIARAVDPIISKHGLSYRFRTKQDEKINVTCVLSHKAGHAEETTLAGPADISGNKNAIQAIGSTLTYLQRYTLVQALGLAASNDDDGKAADDGTTITEKQIEAIQSLIVEVGADIPRFLKYFKIEKISELPASQFKRAIEALECKREKLQRKSRVRLAQAPKVGNAN